MLMDHVRLLTPLSACKKDINQTKLPVKVEGYDGVAVQKIKTTEWDFNSQTLKVLLIDVFSPHFLHRLTIIQCVYDLRSFPSMWHPRMQLSSWRAPSYVPLSSSLCCSKWYFSHSKLIYFSQASIKELQVWRSQFNFKTQKPSFFEKLTPLKVKQAAQQRSTTASTGHVGTMQQF